jgi:hypothetical protein
LTPTHIGVLKFFYFLSLSRNISKGSNLFIIIKIQITITMHAEIYFLPIKVAKIKGFDNSLCYKSMGKQACHILLNRRGN